MTARTQLKGPLVIRVALFASFVGTVVLANWLASTFGLVPAGFGLMVVAGTYAAGLALGLRDGLHEAGGARWVLAGIAAGAGLSFLVSDPLIATASTVAFLLSELADFAVYARLRKRDWLAAVAVSNTIGAFVDTRVFLALAPFPVTLQAVDGQLLVKAVWVSGTYLLVATAVRRLMRRHKERQRALSRQRLNPAGA